MPFDEISYLKAKKALSLANDLDSRAVKQSSITWESITGTNYMGHGGISHEAPINTLPAYDKAVIYGFPFSVDLYETKDGVLVCAHDNDLSLKTDATGNISDSIYNYVANADAGAWFADVYAGKYIPTLDELFASFTGKALMVIDVKGVQSNAGLEKLADKIKDAGLEQYVVIQSNSFTNLDYLYNYDNNLLLSLLYAAVPDWTTTTNYFMVNLDKSVVTQQVVNDAHANGNKIGAWVVNTRSEALTFEGYGVDVIPTDDPHYVSGNLSFTTPFTVPVGKEWLGTGWKNYAGINSPNRFTGESWWIGRRTPPNTNITAAFLAYELPSTGNYEITFKVRWNVLKPDGTPYASIMLVDDVENWNEYFGGTSNKDLIRFDLDQSGSTVIYQVQAGALTNKGSNATFVPSWSAGTEKEFSIKFEAGQMTWTNVTDGVSITNPVEVRSGSLALKEQIDIAVDFKDFHIKAI